MNTALIVLLALMWAVFLLPGALRARRSSPVSSVGTFSRAMDVLARRDVLIRRGREGRYVYVPRDAATIMGDRVRRRREVIAKRRTWFVRLLIATGALAPFAIFLGGALWLVFLGVAAGLGGYAFLLRRWKVQADRAAEVVRALPDIDEAVPADAPLAAGGEDVAVAYAEAAPFRREESSEGRAGVRVRRWDG